MFWGWGGLGVGGVLPWTTDDITEWLVESLLASSKARLIRNKHRGESRDSYIIHLVLSYSRYLCVLSIYWTGRKGMVPLDLYANWSRGLVYSAWNRTWHCRCREQSCTPWSLKCLGRCFWCGKGFHRQRKHSQQREVIAFPVGTLCYFRFLLSNNLFWQCIKNSCTFCFLHCPDDSTSQKIIRFADCQIHPPQRPCWADLST